jgi:hypothetical protein
MAGYHIADIPRGQFGEASKIMEEALEFQDAILQGNPVMALCELSDMLGAVEGFLERKHPTITLNDLIEMKVATKRAFTDGTRNPRDVE